MARASIKQITRAGSIYLIPTVLTRALSFLLLPLYTHNLTKGDYGIIGNAQAGVSLIAGAASLGMIDATLRLYFKVDADREKLRTLLSTILLFMVALLALALAVVLLALPHVSYLMFNQSGLEWYTLIAFCAMPFTQAAEQMLVILQDSKQASRYAVVRTVSVLTTIAFIVLLVVIFKRRAMGSLIAQLIGAVVAACCAFTLARDFLRLRFDTRYLRMALKFGVPLLPYTLAGWITGWIDTIFLTHYYGHNGLSVAGSYRVAYLLSLVLQFGIASISQAWTPIYYQILEARGREGHAEVTRTLTFVVIVFSAGALGLALFSREVMGVMTARSYHDAYHLVPFLVLNVFFGGLNGIVISNIYFSGNTRWMAPVQIVSLLVVLPATFLLVPALQSVGPLLDHTLSRSMAGSIGAAIAVALSSLIATTLNFVIAQRLYPMRFHYGDFIKIVGLVIGLYLLSLPFGGVALLPRVALKVVIAALFPLGLLLLGVVHVADVRRVMQVGQRVIARRLGSP